MIYLGVLYELYIYFTFGKGCSPYIKAKFKRNRTTMKNILGILAFSCLLMTLSCKKDKSDPIETSGLDISFRAVYDGDPLVLNQEVYDYQGSPIRFSKVNFYIANVVAINEDGETELSEIQFIDLSKTHNSTADAREGTVMEFSKVPVGIYDKFKFGIGVPSDLNKTTPSEYSTSHPLGTDNSGEYWEAWDSYIFAKVEGQYDENGDGFDGDDVSFAYHIGMNKSYQTITWTYGIDLIAGEATNLNFVLDLKKLLVNPDGEALELKPHDPTDEEDMEFIRNNFPKALVLKI